MFGDYFETQRWVAADIAADKSAMRLAEKRNAGKLSFSPASRHQIRESDLGTTNVLLSEPGLRQPDSVPATTKLTNSIAVCQVPHLVTKQSGLGVQGALTNRRGRGDFPLAE